jgi:hypothetical protein
MSMSITNNYYDYTQYLGPGWDKDGVDYEKSGCVISTHQSWLDILVHMCR